VALSPGSRSAEKFMHGIKVLMAKNYIDNLSEETQKGMHCSRWVPRICQKCINSS